MATAAVLSSEYLRCPVCLDVFREPVTIPCGHSFCLGCIAQCRALQGSPTCCPQCRCPFHPDTPPRLCKNSILSQMVEDFSNPDGSGKGVMANAAPAAGIGRTPGTSPMPTSPGREPAFHQVESSPMPTSPGREPAFQVESSRMPTSPGREPAFQVESSRMPTSPGREPAFQRESSHMPTSPGREPAFQRESSHMPTSPGPAFQGESSRNNATSTIVGKHQRRHPETSSAVAESGVQPLHTPINGTKKQMNLIRVSSLRQRREVTQSFSDMVQILQASGFRVLQLLEQAELRALEQAELRALEQAELRALEWAESRALERGEGRALAQANERAEDRALAQADGDRHILLPQQRGDQSHSSRMVPGGRPDQLRTAEGRGSGQEGPGLEELPYDRLSVAVSELKAQLLELCADHMGRMVQQVWGTPSTGPSVPPALLGIPLIPLIPRVRAEFLQYSRQLSLDPDTAHRNLSLTQGGRRVLCKLQPQPYPDHPGRFDHYTQVLCREPLSRGRHYWEVHLSGNRVGLGVSYQGISRKGHQSHCLAGRNAKSWCLEWTSTRCCAWHDGQRVLVAGGQQERLGVFLDCDGGSLSFHEASDDMLLLHRFQASFGQPVYPIFFISWNSIATIGGDPPNRSQTKRFHRQLSANF